MILERFVMLGKTVPERSSDGREMVCSAGYDLELRRLIRIYPLGRFKAPPRWSVTRVQLQRNPRDSRDESWQLATDLRTVDHDRTNVAFMASDEPLADDQRFDALEKHFVSSIKQANERRISLALIQPKHLPVFDLEWKEDHPNAPQLGMFDDHRTVPLSGTAKFAFVPRLAFEDDAGTHHLQLRDWGVYERARKCGKTGDALRDDLAGALSINETSCLLVGNLANKRNAWLVISVLNLHRQASLFDTIAPEAELAVA